MPTKIKQKSEFFSKFYALFCPCDEYWPFFKNFSSKTKDRFYINIKILDWFLKTTVI